MRPSIPDRTEPIRDHGVSTHTGRAGMDIATLTKTATIPADRLLGAE
jgi:hypothetical protein